MCRRSGHTWLTPMVDLKDILPLLKTWSILRMQSWGGRRTHIARQYGSLSCAAARRGWYLAIEAELLTCVWVVGCYLCCVVEPGSGASCQILCSPQGTVGSQSSSRLQPQILPQNRGQANGHGIQTLTKPWPKNNECISCPLQTDQTDLGMKRSGGDKSPRLYLKSRTWRRGGRGGRRTCWWPMGEAQQPGDGGDTGKPGKPLDDVAAQRLVHTKGETVEERVTSAVGSTSPHLPSHSTPL
jgi:hypothetical protein